MQQEELRRVELRLDRIEKKLDTHLNQTMRHDADLLWIKGHIRFSITALIAIGSAVVTALFKLFVN